MSPHSVVGVCYSPLCAVAVVGLQQTEYQVDEGAGTITVCGEVKTTSVDCIVQSPFSITFTTSDRTGIYIIELGRVCMGILCMALWVN